MHKIIIAVVVALATPVAALAQSACPSIYLGTILTPAQWNACFSAKQDALNFSPVNKTGDTMSGRLVTTASTAAAAGFNITPGAAPTSPANGDVWTTSVGLYAQIGGAAYQLTKTSGRIEYVATGVNFNSSGDTAIALALPPLSTRYLVDSVRVSNASHSLVTATAGVFTGAGGTGTAIVTGASAITVSATADATNNNAQSFTVNNKDTESYTIASYPTLYFRIGTAEGVAATADVTITITPLP